MTEPQYFFSIILEFQNRYSDLASQRDFVKRFRSHLGDENFFFMSMIKAIRDVNSGRDTCILVPNQIVTPFCPKTQISVRKPMHFSDTFLIELLIPSEQLLTAPVTRRTRKKVWMPSRKKQLLAFLRHLWKLEGIISIRTAFRKNFRSGNLLSIQDLKALDGIPSAHPFAVVRRKDASSAVFRPDLFRISNIGRDGLLLEYRRK